MFGSHTIFLVLARMQKTGDQIGVILKSNHSVLNVRGMFDCFLLLCNLLSVLNFMKTALTKLYK